jgi:putative glutamine amidotransferase
MIGISSGRGGVPVTEGKLAAHYVGRGYVRAVVRAGGVPLVLPAIDERTDELVGPMLDAVDGLVLSGGCDLSPSLYGGDDGDALDADPVRDGFELALLDGAIGRGIPVIGICRGMELINVAYGGTLRNGVQHPEAVDVVSDQLGTMRVHDARVDAGTLAHTVFGEQRVEATCVHHQAPDRVGDGLVASIRSGEGDVEGVEDAARRVLGVIWHPELGLERTPTHQRLYDWVVTEAAR